MSDTTFRAAERQFAASGSPIDYAAAAAQRCRVEGHRLQQLFVDVEAGESAPRSSKLSRVTIYTEVRLLPLSGGKIRFGAHDLLLHRVQDEHLDRYCLSQGRVEHFDLRPGEQFSVVGRAYRAAMVEFRCPCGFLFAPDAATPMFTRVWEEIERRDPALSRTQTQLPLLRRGDEDSP